MARTRGSRNADYEAQRAELTRKVTLALQQEGGAHASMRELAEHAGVSVTTLRHYFTDRDGLLHAVMEGLRAGAAPYLAMAAQPVEGDVRASLLRFLEAVRSAWFRYGVGKMYASTLAVGLGNPRVAPSVVNHVLEPLLQTGETLLRRHLERGELEVADVRHASLALLTPVLFALLHQDSLGGAACRPLDVSALVESQVDAFVRAYAATPRAPRRASAR